MNNTEDGKGPLDELQKAAEALKREVDPLAQDDPATATKILLAGALQETADDLKRLAKGLEWLGLRWVPEPLKRTAEALTKLTPADIAEDEKALSTAADALLATAGAMNELLVEDTIGGPAKLELLWRSLGVRHRSAMDAIVGSLTKTAKAVGSASSADQEAAISALLAASRRLQGTTQAIEEAKAKEKEN